MNVFQQLQSLLIRAKDFSMGGVERKGQQRQRQAGLIKQVPKQLKRAYDARGDALAIRRSEITGNTDELNDRQFEQQLKPGTKITEDGKDLYWSGTNYGWQSKGSYEKLEAKGQFRFGENTAQRLNNDLGEGIQAVLGEEGTRRLGLAINKATETYDKHAPQVVKDTVNNIGGGLSQANQAVSKATGIGPTLTGELLTEGALLGGGKALKVGGKALDAVQPVSRAQEAIRDARGLGAKALNTGGSVGAAGAPQTARQRILSQADAYTGRRLDNDAADGIQKVATKNAPKNTVNSKGQTRGAGKAKRVQQNAQRNAVESRRQELQTQSANRREALTQRPEQGDIQQFRQQTRGQQAQQNVVRRRESNIRTGRESRSIAQTRQADFASRNFARRNGEQYQPMQGEFDTVRNSGRLPIGGNAPGGAPVDEIPNGRIRGPRNRNTVDGRRVVADSENRALRQRETDNANRAARRQRQQIARNQEELVLRNQIKGKPNRQRAAVERARDMGNGRLAEANYTRRATAANKTATRVETKGLRGDENPAGSLRRNGRIRRIVENEWPEEFVDRKQMQAARPANTLKAGKKIVADTTRQARASRKAREVAKAQRKADRSKASLKTRQGSGNKTSTATYKDGKQPSKGGKEGSRLFTPRNRAEAAQRAGSKLNAKHSEFGRNASVAGGKVAYANKHTAGNGTVHDVGFRSTDLRKQYARDTERKLRGDTVAPKSRTKRKQDSAVIKNNLATVFAKVKEGDVVTASPIEGIKGRNGRAKLYDRMSKGALKSDDDQIHSLRLADNKWKNTKGEVKDWDPEILRQDLEALTKTTPEQLRGKAIGGNSSLRVKATGARTRTRGLETPSTNRSTKTQDKRRQAAMKRISQFAKLSDLSIEEAIGVLQDQLKTKN